MVVLKVFHYSPSYLLSDLVDYLNLSNAGFDSKAEEFIGKVVDVLSGDRSSTSSEQLSQNQNENQTPSM
jgi:hypothetical protein